MHLKTRRLYLREFELTDFHALREIDSDPEVLRYRSRDTVTESATLAFLEQVQDQRSAKARTVYPFALVLRQENRLIGQCGITLIEPDYRSAYLWFSTNRRYWGKGFMTEAAIAVLDFGFRQLKLQRIEAGCHPDNSASARVLEKIGLRPDSQSPPDGLEVWPLSARRRFALSADQWNQSGKAIVSPGHP